MVSNAVSGQADTIAVIPTNSFKDSYRLSNPDLHYSYDEVNQVHDYSGNWDFDNDGKNDELYFVGTGGAHLYFYLRIVLSKNRINQNFDWILCDMPYLGSIEDLSNDNDALPQFIVSDFSKDSVPEIYIRLDSRTSIPKKLRRKGITSDKLKINYRNKKMIVENFTGF